MRGTVSRLTPRLARDASLQCCVRHSWRTAFVPRGQTVHSGLLEPLLPPRDRRCGGPQRRSDLPVTLAFRQCQNQPRPEHIPRRERSRLCPSLQLFSLLVRNPQHSLLHYYETHPECYRYRRDSLLDSPPILISKTPIALGIQGDQNFRKLSPRDQDLHSWAMAAHPIRPTAQEAAECFAVVESITRNCSYPLAGMPLMVVSVNNDSPNYWRLQRKLLSLSHDSKQVIAENSSHMVIVDQPEVIIDAIQQVITAVRNHASLQR